jgi:hypothetical protein
MVRNYLNESNGLESFQFDGCGKFPLASGNASR